MTFNTHVCIIISSIPSNTIDYVRINEKKKTMRFNTSLLHAGVTKETNGSTLPPVYQTSAFEQESAADLEKIFENKAPGYCYTRVANPTITAFENRITKLEGGIASVACASGMAALMNTFLNILSSGDELISSASLYGGTIDLFHDLEAFGITTRYVENNNWQQIEDSINEHTRLIFAETIGNPCLDVTDIEKLAEIAHAHDIPLVVDNTTSTAYLIQVLKHGADIVVNSSSKYINGSSNAISGILTDSGKFKWDKNRYPGFADYVKYGPMAFVAKLRNSLFRNMGACLAPVNAYLNIIGLETLGLRMERECSNALELASWIENNYPDIKVNYPGLCSSKWHEIAKKQLTNGYGAILTIRVGSKEKAFKFIDSLTIPYTLSNIGDTKTLVIHPGSTISLHSTDKQKEDAGVFEDLIRVSVGIEDIDDLDRHADGRYDGRICVQEAGTEPGQAQDGQDDRERCRTRKQKRRCDFAKNLFHGSTEAPAKIVQAGTLYSIARSAPRHAGAFKFLIAARAKASQRLLYSLSAWPFTLIKRTSCCRTSEYSSCQSSALSTGFPSAFFQPLFIQLSIQC